jgi:hypothetical protein
MVYFKVLSGNLLEGRNPMKNVKQDNHFQANIRTRLLQNINHKHHQQS